MFGSITVFFEIQDMQRCNVQTVPKFSAIQLTKRGNAQIIPKIPVLASMVGGGGELFQNLKFHEAHKALSCSEHTQPVEKFLATNKTQSQQIQHIQTIV